MKMRKKRLQMAGVCAPDWFVCGEPVAFLLCYETTHKTVPPKAAKELSTHTMLWSFLDYVLHRSAFPEVAYDVVLDFLELTNFEWRTKAPEQHRILIESSFLAKNSEELKSQEFLPESCDASGQHSKAFADFVSFLQQRRYDDNCALLLSTDVRSFAHTVNFKLFTEDDYEIV